MEDIINKPKIIVICGPTASGKTGLAIDLAKKIDGEIISCDSMQVYQEMNIGTAKPTLEEMQGIKHYLLNVVSPNRRYSVAEFKQDAKKAIEEILAKGKMPILVGGTGLYLDSLTQGIEFEDTKIQEEYRRKLEERAKNEGVAILYEEAKKIDPEAIAKISKTDQKRVIRILEIYEQTGKTKTQLELESRKKEIPYDYHIFGIQWQREILYQRINQRVDQMIEMGLIQEVQELLKKYPVFPTAMQALGYKEVVEYLQGQVTKEEMIEKLKMQTRRYAKRQLTWFRRNKQIHWLEGQKSREENISIMLEDR